MRSCIRLFYIGVFLHLAPAVPLGMQDEADVLYRARETLANARRAADIWSQRVAANPRDFESAWKLARAHYWLGTRGLPERERKAALEAGLAAGRKATAIDSSRPEGHFWIAANMGALAESFGLRQGIRYRTPIREELERVLEIDPAFLDGSADRALGRWYYKVPGLFGGNKRRAEEHLRKALTYNPQSIITRLFLAETLVALDRDAEARRELEGALAAPVSAEWAPEDRAFKDEARALLARLSR
jgi:tetratricopeptide (TPR) repeat protein